MDHRGRIFTARKQSLGQGNIFIGMCQEFCSQGGGVPGQVHPPEPGTPPRPGTPPGTRYTHLDQVHPPGTRYTPLGPGTPKDQVHPPD